jgi:hypothetical protein
MVIAKMVRLVGSIPAFASVLLAGQPPEACAGFQAADTGEIPPTL